MNKYFRIAGYLRHKLEELGVSVPKVLRRAGLPQNLFEQPRIIVQTEELFAFWRAIAEISEAPEIGLLLGTESKIERFHPSGIAALSARDFGAAIDQIARYKRLTCPEEILQEFSADEWKIQFRWLLGSDAEPHVLTECCFAWILAIARLGTGKRLSPLRIELRDKRPHLHLLKRHFGCSVVCGEKRNSLVFRAADARLQFVTQNEELLAMLAPQFEEELRQFADADSFVELVRSAIREQLTGRCPTVEEVARRLHHSPRTLQRRLQDNGSNFRRELDEARRQLARHYLESSCLELNEIAYLLGYEDANSFIRAFRSWEGSPPGQWREALRMKVAS
jgi:AraC-like DNA-binding protein